MPLLFTNRPDQAARRLLLERAAALRAALVDVRDHTPRVGSVVELDCWVAAQHAADLAWAAYRQACTRLPYRDRLGRRLAREWQVAVEMHLWHGRLGFQTAEDVAYSYLRRLPDDRCPPSAPREVRRLTAAAIVLAYRGGGG